MSGTIDLYYFNPSPPCRSVMMMARAVGVNLNLKTINILAGENLTPEYLKVINIQNNTTVLLYFQNYCGMIEKYIKFL